MSRRGLSRWVLRALPGVVLALLLIHGEWQEYRAVLTARSTLESRLNERLERQVDTALHFLRHVQNEAEARLKTEIAQKVDEGHAILDRLYDALAPRLPPAAVTAVLREALRDVRFFDGQGYYFIDGMDGSCVLLPINPGLEGTSLLENRDDQGTYIMRDLIAAASPPDGAGYARYRWFAPGDHTKMREKIAYARHFAPLDWLIGTGEYLSAMQERQRNEAAVWLRGARFGRTGGIGVISVAGHLTLSPELSDRSESGSFTSGSGNGLEKTLVSHLLPVARSGGGAVVFPWIDPETGQEVQRWAWVSGVTDWGAAIYASAVPTDFGLTRGSEISFWLSRKAPLINVGLALVLLGVVVVLARPARDDRGDDGR